MDEWVHAKPTYIETDYLMRYKSLVDVYERRGQTWYLGTGVKLVDHPYSKFLEGWCIDECGACKSRDVLVIAARGSMDLMTDDQYWDCEVACQACGKFTVRSFGEND